MCVMYRFKCMMYWIIAGVKYQAKGYSNTSPARAYLDAANKVSALCDEYTVPGDAQITRYGVQYYKDGKPVCMGMWIGNQTRSPWADAWI
jgi:hypothetical protein